ncbi:cytochrome c oxidase accessory protein CcoG [Halobacteriovorax marinus]|uniref:Cytochrome c oxidase accessory protein CcoG n=1 Tax=Halobacteriovorax marinus TaxID=97084 RepID=A0A1Y5F8L7_9BACT|nr:cytochrome c oxidase accessory protein CcoG [Halobacteriovorax marinus]
MGKNPSELHDERLATTDSAGHRVYLYPEDVKGKWRTRRNYFYNFLIAIYLILPWINIGGKQSILLDIAKREFTIFGATFYGHDAPLLIFFFLGFVFLIGFITSIWGRIWCGWACPQTVFIDAIYSRIEKLIEGPARKRKKLDQAPWNFEKVWKKTLKWTLFILASMHIAHSFIGYFVGARELIDITLHSPSENMPLFVTTWITVLIILFDFAWFKEQFCLIACPYGRFQAVMMDENSVNVIYDYTRGEPRREKGQKKSEHADCIDCFACVKACPTGIDIRRGSQLECIACTNCIDACDDIMNHIGKPEGLIRYDTELALEGKKAKKFSVRNIVYLISLAILLIGFISQVRSVNDLDVVLLRGSKTPFKMVYKGNQKLVVNHFKLDFDYQGNEFSSVYFKIKSARDIKLVTPRNPYPIRKGMTKANVFFRFSPNSLSKGSRVIYLQILKPNGDKRIIKELEVRLVGPIK